MERQSDGKAAYLLLMRRLTERGFGEGKLEGLREGKLEGFAEGKRDGFREGKLRGMREGELKGCREALLGLAAQVGVLLTEDDRMRLQECGDMETLERCLHNVLLAKGDIFD